MLLVIDMQTTFEAACNARTQDNVCREIRSAHKRKDQVVVVEFSGCHPTVKVVKRAARLAGAAFIKKDADDGSREVINWSKKNNVPLWNIRVCGVNTDACVAATTKGLSRKLPSSEITVVADACNSYDCKNHGYSALPKRKNVRVVRKKR